MRRKSTTEILGLLKWVLSGIDRRSYLALILFVILGFFQGVGIVLIIPMLSLTGLNAAAGPGESSLVSNARDTLDFFHIPVTFQSVLILFVCIVMVYAAVKYYSSVLNASLSQGYSNKLRKRLHHAVMETQWMTILKMRSSDMIGLITTEAAQVNLMVINFIQLTGNFLLLAVHICAALFISVPVTCFVLGSASVLMLLQRKLFGAAILFGKQNLKHSRELQSNLQEHFKHIKLAKSQDLNRQQRASLEKISDAIYNRQNQYSHVKAKSDLVNDAGAAVLVAGFLYFVFSVFSESVLDLVLLMFVFSRILPGFRSCSVNVQTILNMLPAVADIKEKINLFENLKEETGDEIVNKISLKQGIELNNVSFEYIANTPVLDHASLQIPAFSITSFSGRSGAGKSTMADLITGLLIPSEGKITADGRSLEEYGLKNWRSSIAYMPQESFLFHDSVRNNLLWSKPDADEQDILNALEQAGAKEFISDLEKGMDTIVGDGGIRLSGGQRQRIILAMALIRKPSLLILDEATNELDEYHENVIFDTILKLKKEMTIIIITHRLSSMEIADHRYILEEGKFRPWDPSVSPLR